jgi:hypothetical protein
MSKPVKPIFAVRRVAEVQSVTAALTEKYCLFCCRMQQRVPESYSTATTLLATILIIIPEVVAVISM